MKWTPIEDLPAQADEWIGRDYLAERARWRDMNGDISTKGPRNGWTRHRGTNGRESVIDTAAGADDDSKNAEKNEHASSGGRRP